MGSDSELRRARILAASSGDAEHAARVEREVRHAGRRARARAPRVELVPLPPPISDGRAADRSLSSPLVLALGIVLGFGLAALVVVASVAFYAGYVVAR